MRNGYLSRKKLGGEINRVDIVSFDVCVVNVILMVQYSFVGVYHHFCYRTNFKVSLIFLLYGLK